MLLTSTFLPKLRTHYPFQCSMYRSLVLPTRCVGRSARLPPPSRRWFHPSRTHRSIIQTLNSSGVPYTVVLPIVAAIPQICRLLYDASRVVSASKRSTQIDPLLSTWDKAEQEAKVPAHIVAAHKDRLDERRNGSDGSAIPSALNAVYTTLVLTSLTRSSPAAHELSIRLFEDAQSGTTIWMTAFLYCATLYAFAQSGLCKGILMSHFSRWPRFLQVWTTPAVWLEGPPERIVPRWMLFAWTLRHDRVSWIGQPHTTSFVLPGQVVNAPSIMFAKSLMISIVHAILACSILSICNPVQLLYLATANFMYNVRLFSIKNMQASLESIRQRRNLRWQHLQATAKHPKTSFRKG